MLLLSLYKFNAKKNDLYKYISQPIKLENY